MSLCDPLLDHLVGAGDQRWRYSETERPSRLQIDDQCESGGLLNREIGRFSAAQDLLQETRDRLVRLLLVAAIIQEGARLRKVEVESSNGSNSMRQRPGDDRVGKPEEAMNSSMRSLASFLSVMRVSLSTRSATMARSTVALFGTPLRVPQFGWPFGAGMAIVL
jgi:hypothetical protein